MRLLRYATTLPFARVLNAKDYVWMAHTLRDYQRPVAPSDPSISLEGVLKAAVFTLTARTRVPLEVMKKARELFGVSQETPFQLHTRERAMQTVRSWGAQRHASAGSQPTVRDQATSSRDVIARVQPAPLPPVHDQPVRLTAENLRAAAREYVDDDELTQSHPTKSEGCSLYLPPESEGLSAGYQSYGDTDSLGDVGQLV